MGKLEDAAAAAEALRNQEVDGDVIDHEEVDDAADTTEKADKSPPGYLSYEDYVKAGKDPKKYKGEQAYSDYHKLLSELKDTKKEVKTFTQQLMAANEATLEKERKRMASELEERLKAQRADGDVDGALETKEQLVELKQDAKKGPPPPAPAIMEFIEDNPILNKDSDEFNPKFFKTMARLQAQHVNKLSGNGSVQLDNDDIHLCMAKAFDEAKEYFPDLFKPKISERNSRQGLGRSQGGTGDGGKGQSLEVRLKNLKTVDNRNPDMNPNPAYETYAFMKEKYGQKAADKFARSVLEE